MTVTPYSQSPALITRTGDPEQRPPSSSLPADYRLGWAMEALREGEGFLANQLGYEKINATREMLAGIKQTLRGALGLSDLHVNHLRRIYNILSADMTDTKPFWNYSTLNPKWEKQARNYTNRATAWYQQSNADRQLALGIKQSLISATGVFQLSWDRRTRDISMTSRNPLDVLPIRGRSFDSYQDCLAVISRAEMTVNAVREQFPRFASYINMDRDAASTGLGLRHRELARSKFRSVSVLDSVEAMAGIPDSRLGALPVVDLFHLYVDDRSVNDGAQTVLMGDWDRNPSNNNLISLNHWSYEVEPGKELYPFKRLIIFTRSCVLYDGPSMYWHGMFPFVKFTPDPDPDSWYGNSPLWDCLPMQRELNRLYQAISDHVQKVLSPPVIADRRTAAATNLNAIDPRKPGQRIIQSAQGGASIAIVPDLDPIVERTIDRLISDMESIAGTKNVGALMTKEQIPEGDTVERLLNAGTPEIRARSRNLETCQREIGVMQAHNFAEFDDEARVYAIFGEDGLTAELYDFDPYSMVPSYTNGDFAEGRLDSSRTDIDLRPRYVRAREFLRPFVLSVRPGSLIESASQNRKMMVTMVRKMGDVDRYTFLKELGFDNLGPDPGGTIDERIAKEQLAMAQAAALAANGGIPPTPSLPTGPPNGNPVGRPTTLQQSPHVEGDASGDGPKMSTS